MTTLNFKYANTLCRYAILLLRGKRSATGEFLFAFNRVEYSGLCGTSIIVQIRYSTFARNTLTPPLPPSPITSLSLHPASFPYSLCQRRVPCGGLVYS